ncbi:class I SAM-dependent RNA methyltransferase [Oceaniovalibus sp. ACAM 378]|uniref:class I SAM-dependent RNA methyltransferase n=1 Tax=Oceaniovalibus sp. ACAM 378 TaxID=2599923 RepID=UPI0011D87DD3|nr:class I SAM-dependent RNA methyltransferase [Oceaniovalibus sp. ACAM 378]TYB86411.1 class I SAM-dependent RNA methyltransferase [Oceaniovalibus sp. ACAM 378]
MEHRIERLGHMGDGIAPTADRGPVFAPRTLPGEVVSGEIIGDRIAAPKIVTPSSDRVTPPCPHYKSCGGCSLQHASDGFVAAWKVDVVRRALTAQGIDAQIHSPETSPPNSRRRATLSARRTKRGATVGFHGRASGTITEIPHCLLVDPAIVSALPVLEILTVEGASRKGEIAFAVTVSGSGLDVSATGGKPLDGPLRVTLAGIVAQTGLARLTWDGETVAMAEPPEQRFGAARVVPPPGAFLQATDHGQAALTHAVLTAVGGAKRVADLFAGCGTFSLPLAAKAEVHAVEGESDMMAALDRGWRGAAGLKRVTCETRDLFRRPLLPDELNRFDAVVIDPPRAGAEAQVAEIVQSRVATVVMVSCNPVTFARDASALIAGGFTLADVTTVDQFRWSPHVELAARFDRRHIATA